MGGLVGGWARHAAEVEVHGSDGRGRGRTFGVFGLGRVKLFCLGFLRGAVGNDGMRFLSDSSSSGAGGTGRVRMRWFRSSVEWRVENASSYSSSIASEASATVADREVAKGEAGSSDMGNEGPHVDAATRGSRRHKQSDERDDDRDKKGKKCPMKQSSDNPNESVARNNSESSSRAPIHPTNDPPDRNDDTS